MSTGTLRIFQTRRWPPASEAALDALGAVTRPDPDRPLTRAELRAGLAGSDVFCPTVSDAIDAALLDGLDLNGKLIANYGAGVSHIDVAAAIAAGATVANTPDVVTEATADIALLLILAVARRAGEGERQLRAGGWPGWHPMHMLGAAVSGKTLGLIGFGRIARALAHRCRHGLGMEVIVHNRSPIPPETLAQAGARQVAAVEDVLAQADFVSLHIPGGADTRHLIGARRLALMRPTAFLINTARGAVVDEAALADALAAGTIAGAGLDVFEDEPRVHPGLLGRDDVVLLPHLGSATLETRTAMGLRVAENVAAWRDGRPLRDSVT